jgi:hypothetical protein
MVRSRSSKPNTDPGPDNAATTCGVPPEGASSTATDPDLTAAAGLPDVKRSASVVNSRDRSVDPPGRLLPYEGKVPPLPDGYVTIVNSVFNLPDPNAVYEEVLAGIRPIKASRASMSELLDALDAAQSTALKARGLLVNTKATIDGVARDTLVLVAAMRDQATTQLEREKEAGLRKKTITEADVEQCLATMFPDEWKAVKERESKAKRTVDLIEDMCERACERARDLRAIVGASRSV